MAHCRNIQEMLKRKREVEGDFHAPIRVPQLTRGEGQAPLMRLTHALRPNIQRHRMSIGKAGLDVQL